MTRQRRTTKRGHGKRFEARIARMANAAMKRATVVQSAALDEWLRSWS
jgi:hypothetical protein